MSIDPMPDESDYVRSSSNDTDSRGIKDLLQKEPDIDQERKKGWELINKKKYYLGK